MCVTLSRPLSLVESPCVRLEAAFNAAGLTSLESYVIRQRLLGRSFSDVAADPAIRRPGRESAYSRQNIAEAESRALRRLSALAPGRPAVRSVAEVVHYEERTDGAIRLRERGRLVSPEELGNVDLTGSYCKSTPAERAHDIAVGRFLRARGVSA
jgi:hypothetical protein